MKRLIYLCSLSALMACKPVERVVYVPDVRTITTEVVTHDTVVVTAIPEHYAERETLDTLSELTNPFAYSRAEVSRGKLTHTLGIHPTAEVKRHVIVEEKIITIRDTIPYRVEVPVYIEKEIRGWRMWVFYAGVLAIITASVAIYRRLSK